MFLGSLFLLAFAGGLAGLYSLRPELLTRAGIAERMRRLQIGTWGMAVIAWLVGHHGQLHRVPVVPSRGDGCL